MSSMKITPILLFLILLVVLVISIAFANASKEGFVSFQQDKKPIDYVSIPTYSKTANVVKLYDNLFFDNKNGNVIEVDSSKFAGNVDVTGNTIISTVVTPRINNKMSFSYVFEPTGGNIVAQDTSASLISSVEKSYNSWLYKSVSKNTDSYSLFYIPWNNSTYVHLLDKTTSSQVSSFVFGTSNEMETFVYPENTQIGLTNYLSDADPSNNQNVTDTFYDAQKVLYQMGKYVKYDITNSNLIIQTAEGSTKSISVYDRSGSPKEIKAAGELSNLPSTVSNVSFKPFTVVDTLGQNLVLYLPYKTNTVIAIIGFADANKSDYTLKNVRRFTSTTIDNPGNVLTTPFKPADLSNNTDSAASEYFKWYWYWKSSGQPGNLNYSDDYMLKTQIVPPVCPSCPACPENKSACTNCGGQGGSGTLSNAGSTVVNGTNIPGAVSNVGTSVANVAGKTVDAAGNVITSTVGEAGDLLKSAGSGTVGLAKDVGSGTVGLAREVGSTTVGLAREVGSGIASLLKPNGTSVAQGQAANGNAPGQNERNAVYGSTASMGTQNADQYSYYGALPVKGDSNFMPVTADFSSFSR